MRSPAAALLVCLLAASACSSGDPESGATAGTDALATTTTIATPPTSPASSESAPTTGITDTTAAATTDATGATTAPVTESTTAPTAPPLPATTPTVPFAVAVPIDTTNLTAPPPIEDLDDGEHVGIVESTADGTIEFDRVEPIDANGDNTVDAFQNENPRLRSVPLPDHVLFDGQVVDRAAAASRLDGLTVLVRLTIVGQRLAAVDQLTVPI